MSWELCLETALRLQSVHSAMHITFLFEFIQHCLKPRISHGIFKEQRSKFSVFPPFSVELLGFSLAQRNIFTHDGHDTRNLEPPYAIRRKIPCNLHRHTSSPGASKDHICSVWNNSYICSGCRNLLSSLSGTSKALSPVSGD